jgi:glycosyltransferase involved in cell wall biosynthesis
MRHDEVALRMLEADVFVFPSLAEGSARVVFEALACGCYVITTPNAGSIVQDGVHGALVPAGDADALAAAIRAAASRRQTIRDVGQYNAELVRSEYRQRRYGEALDQLYDDVSGVDSDAGASSSRTPHNGPSEPGQV